MEGWTSCLGSREYGRALRAPLGAVDPTQVSRLAPVVKGSCARRPRRSRPRPALPARRPGSVGDERGRGAGAATPRSLEGQRGQSQANAPAVSNP